MSNFLEDIAYLQYENKLPERYDEEPLFHCSSCGEDIFCGEQIVAFEDKIYCCNCAAVRYAEREGYEE